LTCRANNKAIHTLACPDGLPLFPKVKGDSLARILRDHAARRARRYNVRFPSPEQFTNLSLRSDSPLISGNAARRLFQEKPWLNM
jgi:hypothetical protein